MRAHTAMTIAIATTAACGDGEPARRPLAPIANAPRGPTAPAPATATAATATAATAPTVADRLAEHGPAARARLAPAFARAGLAYPPRGLTLIAIKDERRLEVWATAERDWVWLADYPVLAASGGPGPKLREGDLQVPEGVYTIDWLNPRSAFHLSLHVSYPSAEDRAMAVADGREALGGAIMIHGGAASIGCLAIGDPAIEELFTLVADTGLWDDDAQTRPRIHALLAPSDLRRGPATPPAAAPAWVAERYRALAAALRGFRRRPPGHPGEVVAAPPPTSAQ